MKLNRGKMFVIGIASMLLVGSVFAQSQGQTGDPNAGVYNVIVYILKFLSWFWVIPAIIAGKLMTNEWVWGSVIHLDKYLYTLWQMMKNFANYFLAFFFLGAILYSFFRGKPNEVLSKIPLLLVATVLIQISWWIIGVLVDISNVLTMTVGSIGYQVMKDKNLTVQMPKEITIDISKIYENIEKIKKEQNANNTGSNSGMETIPLSSLVPNANSVSGPLVFFGASVLSLFDLSKEVNDISWKTITVKTMLSFIVVLLYVLPLMVLAVVNFVRIFWIWMFIIFSPFIFIDLVFKGVFSKKIEGFKKLSFSNLIGLIFMPVAVVGMLSVGLVFVASMQNILSGGGDNKKVEEIAKKFGVSQSDDLIQIQTPTSEILIDNNIINLEKVKEKVGGGIGYLIMFLFIIFFLWTLLPLGFKVSELTAGISDAVFKFAKDMAMVTPIPGLDMSPAVIKKGLSKGVIQTDMFKSIQSAQAQNITNFVNELTGVYKEKLSPSEINEFQKAMKTGTGISKLQNFAKTLYEIAGRKEPTWSMRGDPDLQVMVKKFLEDLYKEDKDTIQNLGLLHLFDSNGNLKEGWERDTKLGGILATMARQKLGDIPSGQVSSIFGGKFGRAAIDQGLGRAGL